jgi:integrase
MDERERRNRDFSTGPIWDPATRRWCVELRYPDGSRARKRFRREREARRYWSAEQARIDNGTWETPTLAPVTLACAFEEYRTYSKLQNRAHASYVEPALKMWEASFDPTTLLTRISPAQIDAVKLRRAQQVAHATVDKDLAVLKSFVTWCIARQYATVNPVRRVKFFNEDNSRLRYLSTAEYERLLEVARTVETSPDLVEKIILAVHTGLRRGSLFTLRWDQIDFLNAVVRIPRTKSGRPHAVPLSATALLTLQQLHARRAPDATYVFAHQWGRHDGQPVASTKNGFATALEVAGITDFTWHDLRHHADSRIMPIALGHRRDRGGDRALPETWVGIIRGARETRGVDRVGGTGLVSRRSAWCGPAPAL